MINCKEATVLMSRSMDRRLPLGERLLLRLHLLICSGCANAGRQMQLLRRAVARLLD